MTIILDHTIVPVGDKRRSAQLEKATMLDLEWGSAPRVVDRQIDKDGGARRVYIRDPDGVAYEFFTAS